MKNKLKKIISYKNILVIGLILVVGLIVVMAADQGRLSYRSIHGTTTVGVENGIGSFNDNKIEEHGVCQKVASNTCLDDVFIPTNSSAEWQSFRDYKPSCVTLDDCVETCDRPIATGTVNNPNCNLPDIKICNTAVGYCQYRAGCNSNTGGGGYYPGVTETSVNASGWLYGKIYDKEYVVNNPTAVCGSGYRLPTSGEVEKLFAYDMLNCPDWKTSEGSYCYAASTLKLPVAGWYGRNRTGGSYTWAYRYKDLEGAYYFSPVGVSSVIQNAFAIAPADPEGDFGGTGILFLDHYYSEPEDPIVRGLEVDFSNLATGVSVRCIRETVSCGQCTSPFGGIIESGDYVTGWNNTTGYPCDGTSCAYTKLYCRGGIMDSCPYGTCYQNCTNITKISPTGNYFERQSLYYYSDPVGGGGGWVSFLPGYPATCGGYIACSDSYHDKVYRYTSDGSPCRHKFVCERVTGPACWGWVDYGEDVLKKTYCNVICDASDW